jgi:hypothetical protein
MLQHRPCTQRVRFLSDLHLVLRGSGLLCRKGVLSTLETWVQDEKE